MADDVFKKLEAAQAALTKAGAQEGVQPWSESSVRYLSQSILVFTVITLVLASVLLWRKGAPAQLVVKVFGLLVILGLSTLLLVVGYSNEQLTPIVGLFGAIAGYLLGKDAGGTG